MTNSEIYNLFFDSSGCVNWKRLNSTVRVSYIDPVSESYETVSSCGVFGLYKNGILLDFDLFIPVGRIVNIKFINKEDDLWYY